MSYTMTIDEPEKAAWFERERATMSDAELGALFVVFLKQHLEERKRAMPTGQAVSPTGTARPASIVESLAGVAKNFKIEDDHGILARAALEKYERISNNARDFEIRVIYGGSCKTPSRPVAERLAPLGKRCHQGACLAPRDTDRRFCNWLYGNMI